jgi:hypothetical protein
LLQWIREWTLPVLLLLPYAELVARLRLVFLSESQDVVSSLFTGFGLLAGGLSIAAVGIFTMHYTVLCHEIPFFRTKALFATVGAFFTVPLHSVKFGPPFT